MKQPFLFFAFHSLAECHVRYKKDTYYLLGSLLGTKETHLFIYSLGFPSGTSGKESACQCRRHKRHRFDPWVGKLSQSRKWQPTPIFLPGKFHGQRSLSGYSPWGHKESDMAEHTHTHTHVYFIFDCARSSLLCGLLFSCGKQRLLSSCSAWACYCSGFSCGARL